MATDVVLPDLGAGSETVRVGCWLVELGAWVEKGDRLVEVQMPGITFDVSAPTCGVLTRIERFGDAVVVPGEVLGWIEER